MMKNRNMRNSQRHFPKTGRITTSSVAPSTAGRTFSEIEILGGNVIAVLTTTIVNHEEEPTITYRGIFKDLDNPVMKAPKPLKEYIWVDILSKDEENFENFTWNDLTPAEKTLVRDHILLDNNLGIGLKDRKDLVWVSVYMVPFSTELELTSEDALADFFASVPRGTVVTSRFRYPLEIEDWIGKAEAEAELPPGETLPPRSETAYLPWSSV